MKNLLVFILILIAAACVALLLTGKKVKDIVPESVIDDLSGTPAVRTIRSPSAEKAVSSSETTREGTKTGGSRIASADTTDVGSAANRKIDAKARELIAGTRRFLSLGDPQNAKGELEAVEGLSCSAEIKKEAETIAEKVLPLYEHLFAMKSEPIEGFRIYELRGGGKVRGWVADQTGGAVTLKLEGGGEATLPKSSIGHITIVDPDKRCEELMGKYLKKKGRLSKGDAMAHHDLAVFCRKRGMDDLAIKHLQTALEIDENVYDSVGDKGAKKLYLMTVWFGSMGEKEREKEFEDKLKERFPSSKYVAMLNEEVPYSTPPKRTAQPPTKETVTPSTTKRTPTPSSSLSNWEAEGDKAYNIGVKHYRKSMPLMGTRGFNRENKLAMDAFDKAVKYYKKAKKEGKTSSRIDTKTTNANSLKYGCFKMARVH